MIAGYVLNEALIIPTKKGQHHARGTIHPLSGYFFSLRCPAIIIPENQITPKNSFSKVNTSGLTLSYSPDDS